MLSAFYGTRFGTRSTTHCVTAVESTTCDGGPAIRRTSGFASSSIWRNPTGTTPSRWLQEGREDTRSSAKSAWWCLATAGIRTTTTWRRGEVRKSTLLIGPLAASDRLYLVNVSGHTSFRRVYEALSTIGFYSLNPQEIRQPQPPDPGELLNRDGSNIASVLSNLTARSPESKRRIQDYLGTVVPGITGVGRKMAGSRETLEFRQEVRGAKHPWKFEASNMSDGTLRALGILVAVFQGAGNGRAMPGLVGIEEPELALHPAAAEVLIDSLRDAAEHIQILVTSHSPDLLDDDEIPADSIIAVRAAHGETRIGPLDEAGRSVLKDKLFTAGELLRMDQIDPDPTMSSPKPGQIRLFGPEPRALREPQATWTQHEPHHHSTGCGAT